MIAASIRKEVWLLLRDRGRLLSLFALPVIFMVVFGAMFKSGVDRDQPRPIALWYAPDDARGRAIEAAVNNTPGFTASPRASADAVRGAVLGDSVSAGLIVPAAAPPAAPPPVELVIDLGAPAQVRAPLQGALTAIVTRALAPAPEAALVEAKSPPGVARPLDHITGFQVTVPGNAVLFGFFISMTVAVSFANERHTGTWRRLLAAPVPRWKLLIGKLVPYVLISILQLGFLFGIGAGAFGMQVAGSVTALVALSIAVSLCATSLGLLLASFGGTERQIGSIAPIVVLVMGLLGGCMFPRLLMSGAMRSIGSIVPHAWALDGYYDVLVRQGTTVADIAPNVAALLTFSAGFTLLGLWRFRFER